MNYLSQMKRVPNGCKTLDENLLVILTHRGGALMDEELKPAI